MAIFYGGQLAPGNYYPQQGYQVPSMSGFSQGGRIAPATVHLAGPPGGWIPAPPYKAPIIPWNIKMDFPQNTGNYPSIPINPPSQTPFTPFPGNQPQDPYY